MIIWLNGAFGAGKTQTAYEIHRRLENSYVYDPENAGCFIRRNMPASLLLDDFQDYPMWPAVNLDMLDYIASHRDGHIIVPMTVTNRLYYDRLVGALAQRHPLCHVILCARRETLLRRLRSRWEGGQSWAARQIDRCLWAFDQEITQHKLHTDGLDIGQTAERAAALAGLTLAEDRRSGLGRRLDRTLTQLRHIR